MSANQVQLSDLGTKLVIAGALAGFAIGASNAEAAIDYGTAGSVYEQSFDSLAASGTTNAWENNATLPGFYLFHSGATNTASGRRTNRPDDVAVANWSAVNDYRTGGTTSSRVYAWGSSTANSEDRALGSLAGSTASADPGDFFYALVLRNTTGAALDSFTLTYTGEQWFDQVASNGTPAGAHALQFSYLIKSDFSASADIPTEGDFGTYTPDSRLDFLSPNTGNTTSEVIPLDGNDPANRSTLSATIDLDWAPNDYLILRFWDDDNNGNDQPVGIDDLSFSATSTAVPEPTLLGPAAIAGCAWLSRRRRQSGR